MKIVAIIPARGNSKGVPQKNLRNLGGIPLFLWSVISALKVPEIDKVILSTEDTRIEDITMKFINNFGDVYPVGKADVLMRPHDLSLDWVQNDDVLLHVARTLSHDRIEPEVGILLQPTSPFRTTREIQSAIEKHKEWNNGTVLGGILTKEKKQGHGFYWAIHQNTIDPIGHNPLCRVGRQWGRNNWGYVLEQQHPEDMVQSKYFKEDGSLYVFEWQKFKHIRSCRMPPFIPQYRDNPLMSIDIDTEEDFRKAEQLIGELGYGVTATQSGTIR